MGVTKADRTPSSRSLTRGRVIEAALALIDTVGADAITMRGVAETVGVTPMALYNHFSSKDDLLRAIAAHILIDAVFDGDETGWRAQLAFCFRAFRAVCLRYPILPRLLETSEIAPAAAFAPMDVTLHALEQAGMPTVDALRTYFTLVNFTLAQTSYQSRRSYPGLEPSKRVRAERLAGRGHDAAGQPQLPSGWDFDAAFEFGLDLILDGVRRALLTGRAKTTAKAAASKRRRRGE